MTVLMIALPVLGFAAAGALAMRKPHIATGLLGVCSILAIVLAVAKPPYLITGLVFTIFAVLCAAVAVLINPTLYARLYRAVSRTADAE